MAGCTIWRYRISPNNIHIHRRAKAAAEGDEGTAAIGSSLAGELFGVRILFDHIQDRPQNITRFLVIGKDVAPPSGKDKTAIMFHTQDRPGAIADVLDCLRRAGVNLSHIDKRPSERKNWRYVFFIDCEGHITDAAVAAAIQEARGFAMRSKSLDHSRARSERFDCHAAITLDNHRRNIHQREA